MGLLRADVSKGTYSFHHQGDNIGELGMLAVTSNKSSVLRLLVTANVVPSSQILVTLMTEAIHSSGMSLPTRATQRNIPEDGILHSHRHQNLKYLNKFNDKSKPHG
jgi:hypothetical protein